MLSEAGMRIAIDHQIFSFQTYGGVSRYFACLAQGLLVRGQDVRVFAPLHRNHYLCDLPPASVSGRHIPYFPPKATALLQLYNQQIAAGRIFGWKPDVVHETWYPPATGSKPTGSATVITVHDMIHELLPQVFSRRDPTARRKRDAVARANHVICISESTRSDLIRLLGTKEEKVSVVHHGFETCMTQCGDPQTIVGATERPFVLYVGQRAGYKNFSGLLKAFSLSPHLRADLNIVAFGGGSFSRRELELISDLGFRPGQVRQLGGGDNFLGMLYEQARAFVYPSLYEGFGLPLLEAMAHHCPVVCSATSSMPEVVGNAGEYFDPSSAESIAHSLEHVVYTGCYAKILVQRGLERLGQFSWQRCADETLSVYQRLGA